MPPPLRSGLVAAASSKPHQGTVISTRAQVQWKQAVGDGAANPAGIVVRWPSCYACSAGGRRWPRTTKPLLENELGVCRERVSIPRITDRPSNRESSKGRKTKKQILVQTAFPTLSTEGRSKHQRVANDCQFRRSRIPPFRGVWAQKRACCRPAVGVFSPSSGAERFRVVKPKRQRRSPPGGFSKV